MFDDDFVLVLRSFWLSAFVSEVDKGVEEADGACLAAASLLSLRISCLSSTKHSCISGVSLEATARSLTSNWTRGEKTWLERRFREKERAREHNRERGTMGRARRKQKVTGQSNAMHGQRRAKAFDFR